MHKKSDKQVTPGITERAAAARTPEDKENILKEINGAAYAWVSHKTRRRVLRKLNAKQ